jgi:hypothetical protein
VCGNPGDLLNKVESLALAKSKEMDVHTIINQLLFYSILLNAILLIIWLMLYCHIRTYVKLVVAETNETMEKQE